MIRPCVSPVQPPAQIHHVYLTMMINLEQKLREFVLPKKFALQIIQVLTMKTPTFVEFAKVYGVTVQSPNKELIAHEQEYE